MLLIPVCYGIFRSSPRWNVRIDTEKVLPYTDGWLLSFPAMSDVETAVESFPYAYSTAAREGPAVITRHITNLDKVDGGPTLLFRTARQSIRIFVNDMPIYDYGISGGTLKGGIAGSAWHLVRINRSDENRKISIALTPQGNGRTGIIPDILIGSKAACLFYLWSNSIPLLSVCGIIAMFGIMFLLFYFYSLYKRHSFVSFLYLGCCSLMADIWFFMDGGLGIFLIPNAYVTCYISFMMTALLPLPVQFYMRTIIDSPVEKRIYTVLSVLTLGSAITQIVLSQAGVPLSSSAMGAHILIIITIAMMFYSVIGKAVREKRRPDVRSVGLFCIGITAILDILRFYNSVPGISTAYFSRIGFLTFIILQGFRAANSPFEVFEQDIRRKTLERIAFTDMMMSLKNRAAFDETMERLDSEPVTGRMDLILFDLNNLKKTNDSCGHKAGDKIIMAASDILTQAFSSLGNVYRIGGDEFCVILLNPAKNKTRAALERYAALLETYNQTGSYPLSIACGHGEWNPAVDTNMDGFFARVDKIMYEDKRRQKGELYEKSEPFAALEE